MEKGTKVRLFIMLVFALAMLTIPAVDSVGQGLVSAFGGVLLGYVFFEAITTPRPKKEDDPDYRFLVAFSLFIAVFTALCSAAYRLFPGAP